MDDGLTTSTLILSFNAVGSFLLWRLDLPKQGFFMHFIALLRVHRSWLTLLLPLLIYLKDGLQDCDKPFDGSLTWTQTFVLLSLQLHPLNVF